MKTRLQQVNYIAKYKQIGEGNRWIAALIVVALITTGFATFLQNGSYVWKFIWNLTHSQKVLRTVEVDQQIYWGQAKPQGGWVEALPDKTNTHLMWTVPSGGKIYRVEYLHNNNTDPKASDSISLIMRHDDADFNIDYVLHQVKVRTGTVHPEYRVWYTMPKSN